MNENGFIDSVQHYDVNSINQKYNASGGLNVLTASAAPPNYGLPGQCLQLGPLGVVTKILPLNSVFTIGWRCQINYPGVSLPGGNLYVGSCVLLNRSAQQLVVLSALPDGTLALFANTTLVCQSDPTLFTIADGIPFYIELQYTLSGGISVGGTIKVNGQQVATGGPKGTGVPDNDTINSSADLDIHQWASAAGDGDTYFKDLYVMYSNGFLGDVNIQAIYPRQDSGTNQWSPVGSPHFSLINEHPPDGDTTYISDATQGDTDTWYFQTISNFNGTILGVQLLLYARKDAEGEKVIQLMFGSFTDGTLQYLADNYRYYVEFYANPPMGGGSGNAWSPGLVNSTAFGVTINT